MVPGFASINASTAGTIGGRDVSLDDIEHGIVRPLGDPRAHAAVICASLSCPPLRREPWDAARLSAQLDDSLAAADLILDDATLEAIDRVEKEIPLSFGEDGLRFL